MSNLTEWIKNELYPIVFENIDLIFSEHNFKRYSGGWRSNTYLNGSTHKERKDKTVISKKAIGRIKEWGGDNLSLIDYIKNKNNFEFIDAVKYLADKVNLTLPKTDFNLDSYLTYKDKTTILEECNNYFNYCLYNSKEAKDVLNYLLNRGYLEEEIKTMELGYIPNQEKLINYLLSKNHKKELIEETLKLDSRIGNTHKFSIPYRSGSSIKGFIFRTIGDHLPKYLLSTGTARGEQFFNIPSYLENNELIIVEGYLDALICDVKGIKNIVALGGAEVKPEQIKDAIKRGAKKFTLFLDTDTAGKTGTLNAIELIKAEGVNKIYIVNIANTTGEKIDADSYVKQKGIEALNKAINEAVFYYEYQLIEILNKYKEINEIKGLQAKDIDNFTEELVKTYLTINEPIDKQRFINKLLEFEAVKEIGITEQNLKDTLDKLEQFKNKEAQHKELKKLLNRATDLQSKGEVKEALELIEKTVKEVKIKDKINELENLLKPVYENEIKERITNKLNDLKSGYTIDTEELLLPSGAITIFTAPTSHGKTSFLINLALNVSENLKNKQIHFFSYEEDRDAILLKALNIYINKDFGANNRRIINSYFKGQGEKYFKTNTFKNFEEGKTKFFNELIETNKLNIHYSNYNSDTLIDAITYLTKNSNVGAIFIDYIQLLNLPDGKYKTYSRQEELKEICQALKNIAVETGLPIILGAQFNRTVDNHLQLFANRIGEAGDIERIANLIVGFWNNDFEPYGDNSELKEIKGKNIDTKNSFYTVILKNRGGKVGLSENLSWNGNTGKISNY